MHSLGGCPGRGQGTCGMFCAIKAQAAKREQAEREEREKFLDRERRREEAKGNELTD